MQFQNFPMMNNIFSNPYVNYLGFDISNTMILPQYYPLLQYGLYSSAQNISMTTYQYSIQNSLKHSNTIMSSFTKDTQENSHEFSKQSRIKQNRPDTSMTVPKTRMIEKKSKLKYLKKNTQSNISNQILTFLVDEKKSERQLFNLCRKQNMSERLFSSKFYILMRAIKAKTKKYLSKKILLNLSSPSQKDLLYKEFQKLNIPISENQVIFFCKAIRILIRIFLSQYSPLAILTSKKIHREGTSEHLVRRRQIKAYLQQQYLKV